MIKHSLGNSRASWSRLEDLGIQWSLENLINGRTKRLVNLEKQILKFKTGEKFLLTLV